MSKAWIGIDPGAKGYICTLLPAKGVAEFISNSVKPLEIVEWLDDVYGEVPVQQVVIEDVHSLHGMSAKSNFTFGYNVGILHGIFNSRGIGLALVTPKVWQKEVGIKLPPTKRNGKKIPSAIRTKEIKNSVAAACDRLYPRIEIRGPKGGLLDGKSDALMIAHYASLIYR